MIQLSILIAAAAFGSDVGWQPLPDGGTEYIIQLGPQELDALRRGRPFQSDIPSSAGEVRAYRIVMGTGTLPHKAPPPRPSNRVEFGHPTPFAELGKKVAAGQAAAPPRLSLEHSHANRPKQDATPTEPTKPWLPLTLTLFGLFASLGSNVYLGWIALGLWRRCRRLVTNRSSAAASS